MHKTGVLKLDQQQGAARLMRFVAAAEALKGLLVFAAGFGLLALLHRDVRHVAVALVTRLHLDPTTHYTGVFIDLAASLTDARLWALAALALLYSSIRLAEAYGLWFERRWAAWLGAASGAIYLPIEVFELARHPGSVKAATLLLNLGVVTYLIRSLQKRPP